MEYLSKEHEQAVINQFEAYKNKVNEATNILLNKGVNKSRAKFSASLNPDAVLDPNFDWDEAHIMNMVNCIWIGQIIKSSKADNCFHLYMYLRSITQGLMNQKVVFVPVILSIKEIANRLKCCTTTARNVIKLLAERHVIYVEPYKKGYYEFQLNWPQIEQYLDTVYKEYKENVWKKN